jgi:hypothetical protein
LRQTLADVLAGYGPPAPDEMTLLCAAAVHQTGHAALLPRNWMTDLVTYSTRLERAGWRVCPRPYATLRPSRGGAALLTGSPVSPYSDIPVSGIWIHRPTHAGAVHALATAVGTLPVHAGTWPQALAHLLAASQRG